MDPISIINWLATLSAAYLATYLYILFGHKLLSFCWRLIHGVFPKQPAQAVKKSKPGISISGLPKTILLTKFSRYQDWSMYDSPTYLRLGVIIH